MRGRPRRWVGWVGGGGACASGNQGQIIPPCSAHAPIPSIFYCRHRRPPPPIFLRARRTAMVPLNGTASAYRMARFFMRRSPDARPGRLRRRRECGLGGGAPRFSNEIGRNSDPRMRGRYSSGASCQRVGIGRRRPSTGHRSSRVRPRRRHSQRAGCKRPCCDPPQGWHLVLPAEASLQVRLPRSWFSDFSLLLHPLWFDAMPASRRRPCDSGSRVGLPKPPITSSGDQCETADH